LWFQDLILYPYHSIHSSNVEASAIRLEKIGHACPALAKKLYWLPFKTKEVKMPKMKTKSGAKKRFRLTGSGKVRGSAAFLSHNLRRRSQKMKRQARGTMILCDADARIVKRFLPYA
jgi:large subunit ribosomal protein L35